MSRFCDLCATTASLYVCSCTDPPTLLCPDCVDPHLDYDSRHSLKKIKPDNKQLPVLEHLCNLCKVAQAGFICCCSYPVVFLCAKCRNGHRRDGVHPICCVSQLPFVDSLEKCERAKLKATYRQCAIDRLNQNFLRIDSAQYEICAYFDRLSQSILCLKDNKSKELKLIRIRLGEDIAEAKHETDTLSENFEGKSEIGRLIWDFDPSVNLSNFSLFDYKIDAETGERIINEQISTTVKLDCKGKRKFAENDSELVRVLKAALSELMKNSEYQTEIEIAFQRNRGRQNCDKSDYSFGVLSQQGKISVFLGYLYDKEKCNKLTKSLIASAEADLIAKSTLSEKIAYLESIDFAGLAEKQTEWCSLLSKADVLQELKAWQDVRIADFSQIRTCISTVIPPNSQHADLLEDVQSYQRKAHLLESDNSQLLARISALESTCESLKSQIALLTADNETLKKITSNDPFLTQFHNLTRIIRDPKELFHVCGYDSLPSGPVNTCVKKLALVRNNSILVFDAERPSWNKTSLKSPIKTDELSAWCFLDPERFFVCGGTSKKLAYLIDISTGVVSDLPNMKDTRGVPGVISHSQSIYIFGGLSFDRSRPTPLSTAETYSVCSRTRADIPPMSRPRAYLNVCLYYELIVMLGGCAFDSSIDVFSLKTRAYVPTPLAVCGLCVPTLIYQDTVVCLLGGNAYRWNPKRDNVFQVVRLSEEVIPAGACPSVAVGGMVFIASLVEKEMLWVEIETGRVQRNPLP